MASDLFRLLITTACVVVALAALFGFPAVAFIVTKFLNKALALDVQNHQKSHQQQLAIEQRVQRLEDVLTSLDHDVRDRLGIKSGPATSLSSRPDLAEAPAAPEAQPIRRDPSRQT